VEVLAFGKTSAQKLVEEVDNFIDMDQNFQKYLIRIASQKAKEKS